jgi:hypothetical protein
MKVIVDTGEKRVLDLLDREGLRTVFEVYR